MRDSWVTSEKSKGKGKGSATQRTDKCKSRATQPAVKGKSFATGGKTKTGKEATLPLFLGPDRDFVGNGKHFRFAMHLQRVAGSKVLAELIIFIGSVEIDFLRHAFCGGSHPAEENGHEVQRKIQRLELKIKAAEAKLQYKKAQRIEGKVQRGVLLQNDITHEEQQLLRDLASGTLLQNLNNAVTRFGHGTLRMPGRSILIGASTGGRTREVLDNWQPPNIDKWMRGLD